MKIPLPQNRISSILIVGALSVILLIGTGLVGYIGYQLVAPRPAPRDKVGMTTPEAPTSTPTLAPSPTSTRVSVRSTVVVVAPTAVPGTPTPTATPRAPSPAADRLPDTGLGLGSPILGFLLAGMAAAARWLRGRTWTAGL